MPVEPHNFPTLRGTKNPNRPSVLLLGAGMSYGLVPSPSALLKEKRGRRRQSLVSRQLYRGLQIPRQMICMCGQMK